MDFLEMTVGDFIRATREMEGASAQILGGASPDAEPEWALVAVWGERCRDFLAAVEPFVGDQHELLAGERPTAPALPDDQDSPERYWEG